MSFPTPPIPLFADQSRVFEDIGKASGDNANRDNLVLRSNEDASMQLQAIFLNLVDFTLVETDDSLAWFVDLATELTTAIFWKKSNGTDDQKQAVKDVIVRANKIKDERFIPQEYR